MIKNLTINAITQYIEDNLEVTKVDIESLVSYSGYSRRYLQKIFKDGIGLSIGKYIQLRRVSRAAVFLRLTHLFLSSISARLCYDSQQTFTREFKKNTGYTPLQYRKNKVWTFRNMTGHRDANDLFPTPDIYHIDRKVTDGFLFKHKGDIPYIGEKLESRWRVINEKLPNANAIYLSNKVSSGNSEVLISTVIWASSEQANTQIEIKSGSYAYFFFVGSHERYSHFINHIYMNVLSFYDLTKRDDFDIEIITKEDVNSFSFQYFLPIIENNQFDFPLKKRNACFDVTNLTFPPT
ncbi:helix-turn-helix domain-containing protein [Yersinia enterocolitica]|uniref:helix-turn-helix domain-containing protein n=1 Tax=Yersinia enterocolitica TaxID=630 RepID=UPI003F44A424